MLMPAAVLVFMILGALAVDYGGTFVAHRDLANAAAAAANDAATQSLDLSLFYETGEIRLVPERAWAIAEQSLAARGLDRLNAEVSDVRIEDGGTSVVVTIRGHAKYVFAKAVPGGREGIDVTASSEAHAADLAE
jgi:Flp pilus assembly protein TadG